MTTTKLISDLVEENEMLLGALELILPLAKGYVAHNRVGSNQKYLSIAQKAINKAEGKTNE